MYQKLILVFVLISNFFSGNFLFSQGCCSGGGSNPLAGGMASGVLGKGELELAFSDRFSSSKKFYTEDKQSIPFFDKLTSNYLFLRTDYGLNDKLTFSVSSGYFTHRSIYEFKDTVKNEQRIIQSKGFGDLILLPRYKVFSKQSLSWNTELTLGLGMKIPLGSHEDSTFIGYSKFLNEQNGQFFIDSTEIWQTSPPTVQTTTGANDFIGYLFFMSEFPKINSQLFFQGMYMRRGWNSLGMRFGDFASFSVFFGTKILKNFHVLAQFRYEWLGKMNTQKGVDYLGLYNIDVSSTGGKTFYFSPQLNISITKQVRFFSIVDIPLYQKMKGTQVAMPLQVTAGINWRFFPNPKDKPCATPTVKKCIDEQCLIVEETIKVWGACSMCKEKIEKTLISKEGILYAEWIKENLSLTVRYQSNKISLEQIKQHLADVGYDTETHRAKKEVYDALPSCCKYKRP
ncbi:MAG: heavy-metal-associated domain-containing protein [Flavobacteriia bacterium]|nr:heavy-metal-associated domain-containing protein [Flavobacteriia bacterium]